MSKAILLSIKPQWVAKILNGEKTIEIRKTMPKCDLPITVYIYCTKEDSLCRICKIDKDRYICGKDFDIKDFPKLHSGYEGKGKVVAKFTLRKVEELEWETENLIDEKLKGIHFIDDRDFVKTCLTYEEYESYLEEAKTGYAYHIEDLVIFDKPKELNDFYKWCEPFEINKGFRKARWEKSLTKAPQNICYVESEE